MSNEFPVSFWKVYTSRRSRHLYTRIDLVLLHLADRFGGIGESAALGRIFVRGIAFWGGIGYTVSGKNTSGVPSLRRRGRCQMHPRTTSVSFYFFANFCSNFSAETPISFVICKDFRSEETTVMI